METAAWFGDTLVTRRAGSEQLSHHAFIVYRGFPGEPPPAEAQKYAKLPKNTTIAEALHNATGADVYVPQYEGLGASRGKFSFSNSVERSLAFAQDLASRGHERIHIAGYSWGGLVGFNAHRALGARRGLLILISALSDLGDDARIRAFLPYYIANYPNIFGASPGALEAAAADLGRVRDRYNPLSLAQQAPLSGQGLLLVHGSLDEEVSPELSRRFKAFAPGRLAEWADDHSYSRSWPRMLAEICAFAQNGR